MGFEKFCGILKKLESPTKQFILLLFNWVGTLHLSCTLNKRLKIVNFMHALLSNAQVVEGVYSEGNKVINNVDVILLLLDWLPSLSVNNKRLIVCLVSVYTLCYLTDVLVPGKEAKISLQFNNTIVN